MLTLRDDLEAETVSMMYFKKAMEKVKPKTGEEELIQYH